ncbi:MAG: hypothetical protein KatS3mg099_409 [Candidatus Parcubacteria bacterium]|nr:MAG: hypothetical protein KatS3mg099_409 [Candidatus Parcubacteria bacterium]
MYSGYTSLMPRALFLRQPQVSARLAVNRPGFSLVELLVSIAVFSFILLAVFAGTTGARDTQRVEQTAHNAALFIKKAQSLGVGTGKFSGSAELPYGVFAAAGQPLRLFVDENRDFHYTSGVDTVVDSFAWQEPIRLLDVCVADEASGGVLRCAKDGVKGAAVVFRRLLPDATINPSPSGAVSRSPNRAAFLVGTTRGTNACVEVWVTGYTAVTRGACP